MKEKSVNDILSDIGTIEFNFTPTGKLPPKSNNNPIKIKTVFDIFVGIPPQEYWLVLFIDGLEIKENKITPKLKKHDRRYPNQYKNQICLNVKTGESEWQLIELENILSIKIIKFMQEWIEQNKLLVLKIADEYEQHERQIYHFMYDLVSIFKSIENHNELKPLLCEINSGLNLFHNRIQAEIYSAYKKENIPVSLFPKLENSERKPDLQVNDVILDVKTILLANTKNREKLLENFTKKLRHDILDKEKKKRQLGLNGSFFIGVWSNLTSSILYSKFHNRGTGAMFYQKIPAILQDQVIFVIPSYRAFENFYLVFDRKKVARLIDCLSKIGFKKFIRINNLSHVILTNIREGCSFGQMAEDLRIIFKFR